MTGFSSIINASQALSAQTYALDVTSRNIANADTPGYTRERADLTATGPAANAPRLYSVASASTSGTVDASSTTRLNDPVLDARARTEHSTGSYLDGKATTLNGIQALVNEPSDTGLSEQLNTFWNSWSAVQADPGNTSTRNTLLSNATSVTNTLNSMSSGLSQLATGTATALNGTVAQINQAAQNVASLNAQIKIAAVSDPSGSSSDALLDQRDTLLSSLAQLAGATAAVQPDGTVSLSLGSAVLVSGTTASTVALDAANNVTVGGTAVTLSGGTAKAQSEALTTTIPSYQASLDSVAASLASTVNTAHQSGYDLNGAAGGAFFSGTTAATISVAITDPSKIAASATGNGTADLDGSVAGTLAAIGSAPTGADASYRTFVTQIGSDVANVTQQDSLQTSITSSVDAQQASASGVSFDDEVTNMMTYQRAYQASARVLTTIDDMMDTLINHTGTVGL